MMHGLEAWQGVGRVMAQIQWGSMFYNSASSLRHGSKNIYLHNIKYIKSVYVFIS